VRSIHTLKKHLAQAVGSLSAHRIDLLSRLIPTFLVVRSVNLMKVATAMPGPATKMSRYRRLQRFFSSGLSTEVFTELILKKVIKQAVWKLYEDHSIGEFFLPDRYSVPEVESAILAERGDKHKGVTFNACGVEFSYLARFYEVWPSLDDYSQYVDVYIEFDGRTVFMQTLSRDPHLGTTTEFGSVETFIEGKWMQAVLGLYEALEREKKAAEESSQKKENKREIEDLKSNFGIDADTDVDDREEGHQKGS